MQTILETRDAIKRVVDGDTDPSTVLQAALSLAFSCCRDEKSMARLAAAALAHISAQLPAPEAIKTFLASGAIAAVTCAPHGMGREEIEKCVVGALMGLLDKAFEFQEKRREAKDGATQSTHTLQ